MRASFPALLGAALLLAAPALAQPRGRAGAPPSAAPRCLGPGALELPRIWITPEAGRFGYRVMVVNSGPRPRRFTVALGFANLSPPPGAGQPLLLQPRQAQVVPLGVHDRRATEEQVMSVLAVACLPG
ncbi:hypothetical protein ACI6QG_10910 [Roseococcus sp. DSY-14]|uniref:hypothetical protein n=1 Tax=Roseococcus sp. DSY-14 TaxID=3369650 RepID=UPI00387AE262